MSSPARPLLDAASAIYFVTTNTGNAAGSSASALADSVSRAIASRYEYLATWGAGRSLTTEAEANVYEAIGVLRLEFFRLTGRAWLAA